MVCPQRSWTRSWIFNSYIGVQLKKTAMLVMLYSGNVFVLNYIPGTHRVGPCNLQKLIFLSIFYDLDNVSTLYMYILFSTDVVFVLLFIY